MADPAPENVSVPEAIGAALTADAQMQTRRELRIAMYIIGILVLVVVFVAVLVALFGLVALNIVALIATALVFVALLAYAAGW